jgi:hypothetical protein
MSAEVVLAKASLAPVMLVTQSCDIDHRKHYQVAPVIDVAALNPRKLQSLREGEVGYWYHLPGHSDQFPTEMYADLTRMTSVHRSYFQTPEVIARLTNAERSRFQAAVAEFHGTPFGFNTRDRVLEVGAYSCVSCFHRGEREIVQLAAVGEQFPECGRCGADALWLLLGG